MSASGLLLNPSHSEGFRLAASRHEFEYVLPEKKTIKILLAMVGAEAPSVPMEVLSSDTIASVKMRIQSHKGFYVNQQRLVYGGRELTRDERLIKDYGVNNGEVLHLVLRISDLVAITVKTISGREHTFNVPRSGSVRHLKTCIAKTEGGLPLEEQLLTLRGEQLDDGTIIENLPLGADAVLHLSVRKPTKVRTKTVGRDLELVANACELPRLEASSLYLENLKFLTKELLAKAYGARTDSTPATFHAKRNDELEETTVGQEIIGQYSSLEPVRHSLIFEIPETLKDLLEQVRAGLHTGHVPILSSEGTGGVYFMRDECAGRKIAVFKPRDEEPMAVNNPRGFVSSTNIGEGLKRGTRIGEGAIREVAAYLLDHPPCGPRQLSGIHQEGYAGVPPTMLVRCYHEAFHYPSDGKIYRKAKVGSLQQFVHALSSCEDMGSSNFPVEEVHKISVLDLRLANADRNGGNILVCRGENESLKLVPIDHGYCLPEKFEDCTFEWMYWPQARNPYGLSTLKYIASLDAEQDIDLLKHYGWRLRPQTARVLRVSTMVLKKGAVAGLTPFQIGSILTREFPDTKSAIETLLEEAEAKRQQPESSQTDILEILSDLLDQYIPTLLCTMNSNTSSSGESDGILH